MSPKGFGSRPPRGEMNDANYHHPSWGASKPDSRMLRAERGGAVAPSVVAAQRFRKQRDQPGFPGLRTTAAASPVAAGWSFMQRGRADQLVASGVGPRAAGAAGCWPVARMRARCSPRTVCGCAPGCHWAAAPAGAMAGVRPPCRPGRRRRPPAQASPAKNFVEAYPSAR